jgi:hypothetical protein
LAFVLIALAVTANGAFVGAAEERIVVGNFSAAKPGATLPADWQPLTFKKVEKHTVYTLVNEGESPVVQAASETSASGLIRKIEIDPREYPIIEWRWKVSNVLEKADVRSKQGDDYPARIYITFAFDSSKVGFFDKAKYETARLIYGEYPPLAAIDYISESKTPVGTIVPNPYTHRTQMIVIESGAAKVGEWLTEQRNVYEDYRKAFGDEPPAISGVAIMTDTDNTGESATAWYGDIVFRKR